MPPSPVAAERAVFNTESDVANGHGKAAIQANGANDVADKLAENWHGSQSNSQKKDQALKTMDDQVVPVAVVGMACRFPQDATSVEAFWQMLNRGRSALSSIPQDRFNRNAFCTSGRPRGGMFKSSKAHCLGDSLAAFDAPFFSISAEEAACMDPQQRLLLETVYHALENAGMPMYTLAASNTSVHIGSFMHDYEHMLKRDPQMRAKYTAVGNGGSVLANRISWFFDLHGPSLTVNTACSSSLTAVHLACQGLRSGETDTALVGGCNVFFDPAEMGDIAEMGILSPDGISRSFDSEANGFSRGEGFGVVVLKRLADAIKEEDSIRAVIRATGTNSSGRTPGITQPSETAQATLIRKIYEEGGVDSTCTGYFEAHGTGTPVGDLLEARAIHRGLDTSKDRKPLYIGAVKSNIGHLEGAAGIAGLIKTVLVLERGVIPANLHFEQPNKKILDEEWNIKFPTASTAWPAEGQRRASQNSFGFAGANAHAILDDAYNYLWLRGLKGRHRTLKTGHAQSPSSQTQTNGTDITTSTEKRHILVWSAPDEHGLKRLISLHKHHHQGLSAADLDHNYINDLSFTLASRRDRFSWRSFAIASSADHLCGPIWDRVTDPIRATTGLKLGFVFTGQGAQWAGMGLELLGFPAYRQSLEAADLFLRTLGGAWSLLDELAQPDTKSRLSRPEYGQPITTALQIAVIDLLRDWSVTPVSAVGHSSGEIAAAYCTGAITREIAWTLSFFRGSVSAKVASSSDGAMMSVNLSDNVIERYLDPDTSANSEHYAAIACINSPQNVTLSGARAKINRLHATFESEGISAYRLAIKTAYHSEHMRNAAAEYERMIHNLFAGPHSKPESVRMFSSVLGQEVFAKDLNTSTYWMESLIKPVRFADAVRIMMSSMKQGSSQSDGSKDVNRPGYLIEIGPHTSLKGYVRGILTQYPEHATTGYGSVLLRKANALDTFLEVAGRLFSMGSPVDLAKAQDYGPVNHPPNMLVDLPPYPFNHTREYWLEGPQSKAFRFRRHPYHELLGWPVSDHQGPKQESRWHNTISIQETPWIGDHRVNNMIVFPGAGMVAMALEAVRMEISSTRRIHSYRLSRMKLLKAITFSEQKNVDVQLSLLAHHTKAEDSRLEYQFRIFTLYDTQWTQVCTGFIAVDIIKERSDLIESGSNPLNSRADLSQRRDSCNISISSKELYQHFKTKGLDYGGPFQRLQDVHISLNNDAVANVDISSATFQSSYDQTQTYIIHPTALDAVFQTALASLYEGNDGIASALVISRISYLSIVSGDLATKFDGKLKIYAKSSSSGFRTRDVSIQALDSGNSSFELHSDLVITDLGEDIEGDRGEINLSQVCSVIKWKPDLDLLNLSEIKEHCSQKVESGMTASYYALMEEKDRLILTSLYTVSQYHLIAQNTLSQPHFEKYLKWAKNVISLYVQEWGDEGLLNLKRLAEDESRVEHLREQVTGSGPDGELIARIHTNLNNILNGKVDALDLMFHDGLLSKAYAAINKDNPAFGQLAAYLDALAHKSPNLKILEIGAGTGGATFEILSTLRDGVEKGPTYPTSISRFEQYVFTDISASFFEKAKARFATFVDRMRFSILDIEQDPASQGFTEGFYDVVVASNVLHATSNLKRTLQNTRKLLKPGGKLILYELVDPKWLFPCFVSGLLSGWWLSTEKERTWAPLLPAPRWHAYLSETGFSGLDLAFGDNMGEESLTSVLVSTAKSATSVPTISSKFSLILETGSETQLLLASSLQRALLAEDIAERCDLVSVKDVVSTVGFETVYLFLPGIEVPFLDQISEDDFEAVKSLIHSAQTIIWVSTSNASSTMYPLHDMVAGLSRVARTENPSLRFITLALDHLDIPEKILQQILRLCRTRPWQKSGDFEPEYMQRADKLCISRVTDFGALNEHINGQNGLAEPISGELSKDSGALKIDVVAFKHHRTVTFLEDENLFEGISGSEVELDVKAIGQDARFFARAFDQSDEYHVGMGCAGVVVRAGETSTLRVGDRACCLTNGTLQSRIRSNDTITVRLPADISFETATSIPTDYCAAYIALVHWGRVQSGDLVLIDSISKGLARASMHLALRYTKAVYILIDDQDREDWTTEFDLVPPRHIISRQATSQPGELRKLLDECTIDVIIASPATMAKMQEHECVAPFSRVIQVGSQSEAETPTIGNIMNVCVDLSRLLRERPNAVGGALRAVMQYIEEKSLVLPKPAKVFGAGELQTAISSAFQGKHSGNMVFTFNTQDLVPFALRAPQRYSLDADATYVIAGGFGGIGRRIARWMAARGARHILVLSRSGGSGDSARSLLSLLKAKGVQVKATRCDVSNRRQLTDALIDCAAQMPPITGCIQAVLVQKPASLRKMSHASYHAILGPKVAGSFNLHELLPKNLSFFVMLSSMAGIVGQPAQGAYATSNTYQDGLAHHLTARGLPAVSLDLPVMLDDGYVAESPASTTRELLAQGHGYMRRSVFESLLDYFCNAKRFPHLQPEGCQVVCGLQCPRGIDAQTLRPWFWTRFPLFRHIWMRNGNGPASGVQIASSTLTDAGGGPASVPSTSSYLARIKSCPDIPREREAIVLEAIQAKVAKHLGLEDPADIDVDAPSMSLTFGIDSLGVVELRGFMRTELDIILEVWGIIDLIERKSIRQFCQVIATKMGKEVS